MIWAILAILGVPIWLIVGILTGMGISRRRFKQHPDVFAVNIRPEGAKKWPRRVSYVRLVRDVLVIARGVALLRTGIYGIDAVSDFDIVEGPSKPAGAVGRLVSLDDGSKNEVAVAAEEAFRFEGLVGGAESSN